MQCFGVPDELAWLWRVGFFVVLWRGCVCFGLGKGFQGCPKHAENGFLGILLLMCVLHLGGGVFPGSPSINHFRHAQLVFISPIWAYPFPFISVNRLILLHIVCILLLLLLLPPQPPPPPPQRRELDYYHHHLEGN